MLHPIPNAVLYAQHMDQPPPKAFISHATEDKDDFVVEFATKLRANGIDAWLDAWEIAAGDSLTKKVFTQGIDEATVFIVVISNISVTKPWVAEELDAGVVRKIQAGTLLIPVVLDGAPIPPALRHLRYVSVPALGIDGAVSDIAASVFGHDKRPPLGSPPSYATSVKRLLADPIDDLVLRLLIEHALETGQFGTDDSNIRRLSAEHDVSEELTDEAIESLDAKRIVVVDRTFGGYFVSQIADQVWLRAATMRGTDVDAAYRHLIAFFANGGEANDFDEVDKITRDALIGQLERDGYANTYRTFGNTAVDLTVEGRRRARDL